MGIPRDIDALEERLVQLHELERRLPGGGRWPFAGDAPWHLMQREAAAGDADARGGVEGQSEVSAPRTPLSRAEVAEIELLREWLGMVPDVSGASLTPGHDRKLVFLGTLQLARGEGRVPWTAIGRWMGSPRSPDALVMRYRRALASVVCQLNGWPQRRAKAMAA